MALPKTTDAALPSVGGLGYVGEADAGTYIVLASGLYVRNAAGNNVVVGPTNPVPVSQLGSLDTLIVAPVTGVKTVTAIAAEIFAGASRLAGRRRMMLKNEDLALRFRIGTTTVNQRTGFPIEPGALIEIKFDPTVALVVYAISEGSSLQVAVMES